MTGPSQSARSFYHESLANLRKSHENLVSLRKRHDLEGCTGAWEMHGIDRKCADCGKWMLPQGKIAKLEVPIETDLPQGALAEALAIDRGRIPDPTDPEHYKGKGMEVWEVIDAFDLDYYEGNVLKYLLRYPQKGGVEDLRKARTYLDRIIERQES